MAKTAVRSEAVILLLLLFLLSYCLLLLPLFVGVLCLILVLLFSTLYPSSSAIILMERETRLLCFNCPPDVLMYCDSQ